MQTPQKGQSPPKDFEDIEEELLRCDREIQQEGGFVFKRGHQKRVSFDVNVPSPSKPTDDELAAAEEQKEPGQ